MKAKAVKATVKKKKLASPSLAEILRSASGVKLDIGCGNNRHHGFIGMDKRPGSMVDLVHDLEVFPYPLPDDCCTDIIGSHIVEHIKPWLMIDFMDELWRIMRPGGSLAFAAPYGVNSFFVQDPTHCNPVNEVTFTYYDPRYPLYSIYQPKPWMIGFGFPTFNVNGFIEILLHKMTLEEAKEAKPIHIIVPPKADQVIVKRKGGLYG